MANKFIAQEKSVRESDLIYFRANILLVYLKMILLFFVLAAPFPNLTLAFHLQFRRLCRLSGSERSSAR